MTIQIVNINFHQWQPSNLDDSTKWPIVRLTVADLFLRLLIGAQLPDLGLRIDDDVRIQGIPGRIVLVISLGLIEGLQRDDLGDDWTVEDMGLVQLVDVGLGHALLLVIGVKDRRAVLPARVRTLPIQLRRVVSDREKDLDDLTVSDSARGVDDLDGFGGGCPNPPDR